MKKTSIILLISLLFISFCQPVFAASEKININEATKSELVVLKYVGDKIADRIIDYRKAHPFEKSEDIMKVKGIGLKIFDANKDLIIVKD
ncbi:ComEA family DNA-binding protein [Desulfobacula toluolica]|uniref:Conserved uncharacterized protein n=1 Tax=Desulfobacula toluolica (strain DSM 7467 / Tol2) TaxID=651182 RepID=K0NMU9_DESTT|nr:helix-hairpin-helix domain-containing protein [Desulfobacula toluolica]CCK81343.1 conserved uncharacterized protein [Desulfobacula toluolica Tol2]